MEAAAIDHGCRLDNAVLSTLTVEPDLKDASAHPPGNLRPAHQFAHSAPVIAPGDRDGFGQRGTDEVVSAKNSTGPLRLRTTRPTRTSSLPPFPAIWTPSKRRVFRAVPALSESPEYLHPLVLTQVRTRKRCHFRWTCAEVKISFRSPPVQSQDVSA